MHPLSFVIDEVRPVSRWKEFGYDSPQAAAMDWDNLQAAHYCCNQAKSNHVPDDRAVLRIKKDINRDGDW
jgi:5-methylcytosine-specific restriction endonuclease McrA